MRKAALALCAASAAAAAARPNVLFFAVDDLRPQFGASYQTPEVKTPNLDAFFFNGGGTVMTGAYVNIAVCGPSRASMLTSRRPDSTRVGVGGGGVGNWCWCRRTQCNPEEGLFATLPAYLQQHGYETAGNGKLFHPDACEGVGDGSYRHAVGDDPRAFPTAGAYFAEANHTQMEYGAIPGPGDAYFHGEKGLSWMGSPLADEETTDGMSATDAVARLRGWKAHGTPGGRPWFLSVGLHKPHLPHIVPKKYFDMYPLADVDLAPNRLPPKGLLRAHWGIGNAEVRSYNWDAGPLFRKEVTFDTPLDETASRQQRRAYYASVTFLDAQVGRVTAALEECGFAETTVVALWGDHGWHLGDTNSWGKMTNFEPATHNTVLWRVPNQTAASQGRVGRIVEAVDIFPTLVELAGVDALPPCEGLDQPASVACVQGASYADLFTAAAPAKEKHYAFMQWPYGSHMGYSVRSADGYRLTEYVPYSHTTFQGNWTQEGDAELYDYNADPHETESKAGDPAYADVVARLRAALRAQFAPQ